MILLQPTSPSRSSDATPHVKYIPVLPSTTIELCLAQFWSSPGPTTISVKVKFHGILTSATGNTVWFPGASGFARVDLVSGIRREELAYSASIDTLRKFVRPTETSISPLKSRDVLPDSTQVHQAILTYVFKSPEGGISVTPRFPKFNDQLYDSAFENFCFIVYDANKRVISFQDIYPKEIKLSEGTYTFKAQILSRFHDVLEKHLTIPLVLDISVKSITLSTFSSFPDVVTNGATNYKKKTLARAGDRDVVWVSVPDDKSYPKDAKAGDILLGKLDVLGGSRKLEGSTLVSLAVVVPPAPSAQEKEKEAVEKEKDDATVLKESIRDLEITHLKKLADSPHRTALLEKLLAEHKRHLPLLQAALEISAKDASKPAFPDITALEKVLEAAATVLDACDLKELAMYFGVKSDLSVDGEKLKRKEMERIRDAVVGALAWKTWALRESLVRLEVVKTSETVKVADLLKSFDESLAQWAQWIIDPPTTDGRYLLTWVWRQRRKGLYGGAIKAVNKYLGENKNIETASTLAYAGEGGVWKKLTEAKKILLEELGWECWRKYEEKWGTVKIAKDWAPF
ncbi:tripeptidyl-peptidase II Tpp2 [Nowakowskiella sp. JEL0078]|nr:tripeptidyl-peptidase II Tpp2 [Nowakowskiella sp. JEL0078]